MHTNIKVPHEFKNARYFQLNGWKGKIVHHNHFYYALNKILNYDWLNTNLTLYSYLVGCCPISDLFGKGEPMLGEE